MSDPSLAHLPASEQLSVCCVPELSPQACKLYGILEAYDTRPDHYVPISQARLATLMQRTTRSVRTYLTELVNSCWVERIRRGMSKPNVYLGLLPRVCEILLYATSSRSNGLREARILAAFDRGITGSIGPHPWSARFSIPLIN
jgi:hypothetical protein